MDDKISFKVEIHLSARHLPRMDIFSKSDPVIFAYMKDGRSTELELMGHTEVLQNTHEPDFQKNFIIDYFFEENQTLHFHLYDSDGGNPDNLPDPSNKIGVATARLGDLVGSGGISIEFDVISDRGNTVIDGKGSQTKVIVRCDTVSELHEMVKMRISGEQLKSSFCLTICPRIEFYRHADDDIWQKVYTSPFARKKKTNFPVWPEFEVNAQTLCCNEVDKPLRLQVMNYRNEDSPKLIGYCDTTLNQLVQMSQDGTHLETVEETNVAEKRLFLSKTFESDTNAAGRNPASKYENCGQLIINSCFRYKEPTFIDYLMGGMEIQLFVAIDFTASNGDPTYPDSLHYQSFGHSSKLNVYEEAISSIGSIVVPYDSDQKIPVWGFGARLKKTGTVSHMFPLTFDLNRDEVSGLDGILNVYRNTFDKIQLSGPTYFAEVIRAARNLATQSKESEKLVYNILLILTDGVVNDRRQTIHEVVLASSEPLSIIIVGVGDADFSDMHILDADNDILKSGDLAAERDIVQFVPMNKFRLSETSRLAAEVLAEVPEQVVEYMKAKNIKPPVSPKRKWRAIKNKFTKKKFFPAYPTVVRPAMATPSGTAASRLQRPTAPPAGQAPKSLLNVPSPAASRTALNRVAPLHRSASGYTTPHEDHPQYRRKLSMPNNLA